MRTKVFAAMVVVSTVTLGCSGKKGDAGEGKWLGAKTALQNGQIEDMKFTVEVPEGLTRKDEELRVEWEIEKAFDGPSVRVGIEHFPPKTLDEAVADTMPDKGEVVTKKEAIDGGFVVISHSARKGLLEARVYKSTAGEHGLSCWATFVGADEKPVGKLQETLDWLEKTCKTLKPL